MEGGAGNKESSFGREVHLAVGRGEKVKPAPFVLKAISGYEVPLINILYYFSLAHRNKCP
jgi:hypothetical protein